MTLSKPGEEAAYRAELASITDQELRVIGPVLRALRRPIAEELATDSDIATRAFADEFANHIRLFHAQHDPGEVLTKKTFEFVFKAAVFASGRTAQIANSATHPGSDVVVDGVGFSLKTEAATGISEKTITISKLMESAWTKECGTAADFFAGLHRIVQHLEKYERILILRAFGRLATSGRVRYELVDIPRDLLLCIKNSKVGDFTAITRAGSTQLPVLGPTGHRFVVIFDGSDQKITIRHLPMSACKLQAAWTIEAEPGLL